MLSLREAAKKNTFEEGGGECKGRATEKNELFFEAREKKIKKMWPLRSREGGGKDLVAIKIIFFLRLP